MPADRFTNLEGCGAPRPGLRAVLDTDPDTPVPRCLTVRRDQQLEIVNTSGAFHQPPRTVTILWPPFRRRRLKLGQSALYDRPFGSYLAIGAHTLRLSLYPGSSIEVWVRRP